MNIFNFIPVIPLLRIYIKYHKHVYIRCNIICDMKYNNLKLLCSVIFDNIGNSQFTLLRKSSYKEYVKFDVKLILKISTIHLFSYYTHINNITPKVNWLPLCGRIKGV